MNFLRNCILKFVSNLDFPTILRKDQIHIPKMFKKWDWRYSTCPSSVFHRSRVHFISINNGKLYAFENIELCWLCHMCSQEIGPPNFPINFSRPSFPKFAGGQPLVTARFYRQLLRTTNRWSLSWEEILQNHINKRKKLLLIFLKSCNFLESKFEN